MPKEYFSIISDCFYESVMIIFIIFLLMTFIEFLVLKYSKALLLLSIKNKFYSYVIASLFGFIPGCVGMFAMDSLYMAGFLNFGALVSTMLASIGDEITVLISLAIRGEFSIRIMILLLSSLFILGIIGGFLADWTVKKFNLTLSEKCTIEIHEHDKTFSLNHFFKHHIYEHIVKKHIWKIFIWILLTLILMNLFHNLLGEFHLVGYHKLIMIGLAALIGLIPISGPGTFLFFLFIGGQIPFSVLITNCIVQDGHGLLPILGYSLNDAIKVKLFNTAIGLTVGILFYLMGY